MRRVAIAAFIAAALALSGSAAGEPAVTGFTSGPVEWVTTVPVDAGTAWGGRIVGDYFYLGSYRHFSIYDVSDPLQPQLMSTTPLVGQGLTMEDIDTNGEILILTAQRQQAGNELQVWDVEDKTAPVQIAALSGAGDHTVSCVLDCTWAYGSTPHKTITDLRNPANPRIAGSWQGLGVDYVHDVTEVAPGWVVASTDPMLYIDARSPAKPKLVAYASMDESLGLPTKQKIVGSNRWPRTAQDRFLLVSYETPFSGQCNPSSAMFQVYDASRWRSHKRLTMKDSYSVQNGTYTDGSPPANAVGCSALWFQHHPDFHNGGMVATAFAEHGMRLLDVSATGRIEELGYYVPYGGSVSATYWVGDKVLYSIDLTRGIDVLRITG